MDKVRIIDFVQYGTTNIHAVAIVFMILMSALVLSEKRSTAVFAVLAVCVFMPMQQRLVLGGLDFSMLRLMMLVAWLRILFRGELRGFNIGPLDRLLVLWVVSASLFHVLRVGPSAIVNRLGFSFDALTIFFLFRALVRTPQDVLGVWRSLALMILVLSVFLVYEVLALHNPFGIFSYSGFEEVGIRDDRARAQGPFSHAILAGTFGSVLMPVFLGVWFLGYRRWLFFTATLAAIAATAAAASSGPVVALGVGVLGWSLWRHRQYARFIIPVGIVIAVLLHIVREKPVWHLIARLASLTGGAGRHRYRLIDAFVRHFDEWALLGTDGTANWGYGLQDITNYYVAQGVGGGLVTLVLFLLLLRRAFVDLRRVRMVSQQVGGARNPRALLAWGYSVSLAVSCVSFISVSYFGQMFQFFACFLATLPALAQPRQRRKAAPTTLEPRRAPPPPRS